MNAIQALSQLSYGPTPGIWPAPFPAKRLRNGHCRPLRSKAASNPAPFRYQALRRRDFGEGRQGAAIAWRRTRRSDLVVVLADADDVGDVVFFFFLFGEEGVVLVVAEIDLDVVLDLGKLVAGGLGFLVGFLERDQFRPFLLDVELLALDFLFLLVE